MKPSFRDEMDKKQMKPIFIWDRISVGIWSCLRSSSACLFGHDYLTPDQHSSVGFWISLSGAAVALETGSAALSGHRDFSLPEGISSEYLPRFIISSQRSNSITAHRVWSGCIGFVFHYQQQCLKTDQSSPDTTPLSVLFSYKESEAINPIRVSSFFFYD